MSEIVGAPPAYFELRKAVDLKLGVNRAPLLIGFDGAAGVGKSSAASWLAWQFGMPTIHLDLYVETNSEPLRWRTNDLALAIAARRERPLVVEGILLLDALSTVARKPDVLVFVEAISFDGGMLDRVCPYLERTKAREKADFILRWSGP